MAKGYTKNVTYAGQGVDTWRTRSGASVKYITFLSQASPIDQPRLKTGFEVIFVLSLHDHGTQIVFPHNKSGTKHRKQPLPCQLSSVALQSWMQMFIAS